MREKKTFNLKHLLESGKSPIHHYCATSPRGSDVTQSIRINNIDNKPAGCGLRAAIIYAKWGWYAISVCFRDSPNDTPISGFELQTYFVRN